MANRSHHAPLCERFKTLGHAQRNTIRMYGEEFDLTSNPMADGNSFAIEAISRTGNAKKSADSFVSCQMITNNLLARNGRAA